MEIVITDLGFKLAPHSAGLSWELFEFKPERVITRGQYFGKTTAAGWKSTGRYPSSVAQGLKMILDYSVIASKEKVGTIDAAVHAIEAIGETILQACTNSERNTGHELLAA